MADGVCCMCGDVGFSDKLFRCGNCCHRLQHSYCSSYYAQSPEPSLLCDWCLSQEKNAGHGGGSSRYTSGVVGAEGSTSRDGNRIKRRHLEEVGGAGGGNDNNKGKSALQRPTTRKYKLLKDVMR